VVGIAGAAMQRVFGDARAQAATRTVKDRDANTEGSKINTGNDTHEKLLGRRMVADPAHQE
jgi:hypothetical protein